MKTGLWVLENRCANSFVDWIFFKELDNDSYSVYLKIPLVLLKFCCNLICLSHCSSYIISVTRVAKLKICLLLLLCVNVCYFKSEYSYEIFESTLFFPSCILLGCSDICDKGGGICIWDFTRDNAQPALGSCGVWNLLHTTKSFFSSAGFRFFIQQRTCVSGKTILLNHLDLMANYLR